MCGNWYTNLKEKGRETCRHYLETHQRNSENRRKRRLLFKQSRALAKGKCEPGPALESIRGAGEMSHSVMSNLVIFAANTDGELRDSAIGLFLKGIYSVYDHEERMALLKGHRNIIEFIAGKDIESQEAESDTRAIRNNAGRMAERLSAVGRGEGEPGEAVALLLTAAVLYHRAEIALSGTKESGNNENLQKSQEQERIALEYLDSLASGGCEEPGVALAAIKNAEGLQWQPSSIVKLLAFAAKEDTDDVHRQDAVALSLLAMRMLENGDGLALIQSCKKELNGILGVDVESRGVDRDLLVAMCGEAGSALAEANGSIKWNKGLVTALLVIAAVIEEDDYKLEAKALFLKGMLALPEKERLAIIESRKAEAEMVLGQELENDDAKVRDAISEMAETTDSERSASMKRFVKGKCLAYLAENGYGDIRFWKGMLDDSGEYTEAIEVLLEDRNKGWDILAGDIHTEAKAFRILVGCDCGKIRELLKKIKEDEGTERYGELLEHLLTREDGEFRAAVINSAIQIGDDASMSILTKNSNAVAESIREKEDVAPKLAEKACIHALQNGTPKEKNDILGAITSLPPVSRKLLQEVARHAEGETVDAAIIALASEGKIPPGAEKKVLAAARSGNLTTAVNALDLYASVCGHEKEIREICEEMLLRKGDRVFWRVSLTELGEKSTSLIVQALLSLKDKGGWEPLVHFGQKLPETEVTKDVLLWGAKSEDRVLKNAALERLSQTEFVLEMGEEQFIELAGNVRDPKSRSAALLLMFRSRRIPSELLGDLADVTQGNDPRQAILALNLMVLGGQGNEQVASCLLSTAITPENERIRVLLSAWDIPIPYYKTTEELIAWFEELDKHYGRLRIAALDLLPGAAPVLTDNDQLLKTLRELSERGGGDDTATAARKALVRFSGIPKAEGKPGGEKAQKIIKELLSDAEKAVDSAEYEEQVWAWITAREFHLLGVPEARELLEDKVMPELMDIIKEKPDEIDRKFEMLIERLGSLENVVEKLEKGKPVFVCDEARCLQREAVILAYEHKLGRTKASLPEEIGQMFEMLIERLGSLEKIEEELDKGTEVFLCKDRVFLGRDDAKLAYERKRLRLTAESFLPVLENELEPQSETEVQFDTSDSSATYFTTPMPYE